MRVLRDPASARPPVERDGSAGLHRSLIERSRRSRVTTYGDLAQPLIEAKRRCRFVTPCRAVSGWDRSGGLGTAVDEWRREPQQFVERTSQMATGSSGKTQHGNGIAGAAAGYLVLVESRGGIMRYSRVRR